MTRFIQGFVACYLLIALAAGFAMKAAIPALNLLGVAYVGLTTPYVMACTALSTQEPVGQECGVIPSPSESGWVRHLFTLREPRQ